MRAYPARTSELASLLGAARAMQLMASTQHVRNSKKCSCPPRSVSLPRQVPEQGDRQLRVNLSELCQCITKKISISEPPNAHKETDLFLVHELHNVCSHSQTYFRTECEIQGISEHITSS